MECLHHCCHKLQETNQQEIVVTVKSLQSFRNRVLYAAIEDDSAKEQLVELAGKVIIVGEILSVCHSTAKNAFAVCQKALPTCAPATLPTNLSILICCKQASIPPHRKPIHIQ